MKGDFMEKLKEFYNTVIEIIVMMKNARRKL
jgi:hypothetical protein